MVNQIGGACLVLLIACDSGRVRHAPIATKEPMHAATPLDAVAVLAPPVLPVLPAYSCMSNTGDPAPVAHMLLHGLVAAPCAELSATDRAAQERVLAAPVVASGAATDLDSIRFTWGCTSHGDTPVVVSYYNVHDTTGAELWAVRDGKARRLDSVSSPAPDEWSAHDDLAIGPTGDFDGDGAAETIIVSSHHASAHGTTFAYRVILGGALRTLPSDLVVRKATGERDGVVRTHSFVVPQPVRCKDTDDPNTKLDCELQPPAGYVRADGCGLWDWEKQAPHIFALGASNTFVPVPAAAAAEIVAATAADRAAMPVGP
jgi:hypothetical protein